MILKLMFFAEKNIYLYRLSRATPRRGSTIWRG